MIARNRTNCHSQLSSDGEKESREMEMAKFAIDTIEIMETEGRAGNHGGMNDE